MRVAAVVALFAAVATGLACGPRLPPPPPPGQPVSFARDLEPYVVARCESCHTPKEHKAGLVLEPGRSREALVGVLSTQDPAMLLVDPGDPDGSYLWLKLEHRAPEGKGMPRTLTGSKLLPPAERELYRRWIADGALP